AAITTVSVLRQHHVEAGIYIDSTRGLNTDPKSWIDSAWRNACEVQKAGVPVDYLVVANWMDQKVKNLPESDPGTLTNIIGRFGSEYPCP
ncbi:MAG: hypothetical protein ACREHG_04670, partial [Candidatus Saccharimonadales bacterium]